MEDKWKQWLAAFLIGALLPGLAFRLGALAFPSNGIITQPQQSESTPKPSSPVLPEAIQILPVLWQGNIHLMDLDTYIIGVVLAEMPATFEMEALKAQAVAARTCALECTLTRNKHPQGAICTDSNCCQAYMTVYDYRNAGGTEENIQKVYTAVTETKNEVITFEGELIEATYFSCSGGKTEDALAVWGTEIPYLQSVESPGEEHAKVFTNTVTFSAIEFAACLGKSFTGSPISWFGAVTHTQGGGVATMVIGGETYTGTQLRNLLSLNSTAFTIQTTTDGITVTTTGKGHRVGMSQYGADAMAVKGCTYQEILSYYYPGTRIDKLGSVE